MKKVLIDTGPLVAFFDESDRYCFPFREFLRSFQGRLYSTLAVVTEVSYLLSDNRHIQLGFLEWIKDGAIVVKELEDVDFIKIHQYMTQYRDTPMDLADATLVVLAEKINTIDILTFDRDFDIYRLMNGQRFNNLGSSIMYQN